METPKWLKRSAISPNSTHYQNFEEWVDTNDPDSKWPEFRPYVRVTRWDGGTVELCIDGHFWPERLAELHEFVQALLDD